MIYIVSPHVDDAMLSLGGLVIDLLKNHQKINIKYIFSVSQWTNTDAISGLRYLKDPTYVTNLRMEEEKSLGKHLGHDFDFLDFPDRPLRFANTPEDEQTMVNNIFQQLENQITRVDHIFFPMGLDHPDHVVAHKIGLRFQEAGYQVLLYEDLPYAATENEKHLAQYNTLHQMDFEPVAHVIDIDEKLELLKLYASQVSYTWLNQVQKYAQSLEKNKSCERYWKPRNMTLNLAIV